MINSEQADVPVPFADLYAQYESIRDDIDAVIKNVIRESAFVRGPYVEKFEEEFASSVDAEHCVSCANGTDALYIAMRALGVGSGDEVIVPAHTWIATSETVSQAGGKVVFADTDASTYTIDPDDIEAKLSSRTVGIIPVHLCGQPAAMDRIMDIAARHGLWVLEDCAQAHLSKFNGRSVGTFGAAATYSFYPGKNLGAMGDGGAIVTGDAALARKMAMFARHGGLTKGVHEIEGINSRLDGLQAAILSVKLKRLPSWTAERRRLARVYNEAFTGLQGVVSPHVAPGRDHVFHLYMVRTDVRDELAQFLGNAQIQTVVNYATALPFVPAYARFGHRPEDFPNAYRNQSRILSLPLYPEMTEAQVNAVVGRVTHFFGGAKSTC